MLLLILALLPLSSSQQQTRSCYSCASEGLRSRWFLTGLPTASIVDSKFSSDCTDPTTNANAIQREPCSGPCFTYIFEDPDTRGGDTMLYVRGCHDSMVGVIADRLTSGGSQNGLFCEYDSSYSRPDSRGKIVSSRTLVEFCGADDGCNKRSKLPSTSGVNDACTGSQYNNTLNGSPLNCYECNKNDGNCNENRCYKKYCTKSVVHMSNSYTTRKTCSNVNLLGLDNSCAYTDVIDSAGDVSINLKYTMCMCKDKQYCNSSLSLSSLFSSLLSLTTVILFTYKQ